MGEHEATQVNASEARRLAQQHLQEDRARWKVIRPLTARLKTLRTDDEFGKAMAEEWRQRR